MRKFISFTMIITLIGLVCAHIAYAEQSEIEMELQGGYDFGSIERAIASTGEKIDECVLDSNGVCTVETKDVEDKLVKEKTPEAFKDSDIVRETKDGKKIKFDGNKYKIVPRTQKKTVKVKSKKRFRPVLIRDRDVVRNVTHKNRVSLMATYGPTGNLDCNQNSNLVSCNTDNELNLGIQLMRDLKTRDNYSVHGLIQGQTNKTIGIGLGVGF